MILILRSAENIISLGIVLYVERTKSGMIAVVRGGR
jgi:hypothetical protein